MPPKTKQKKKKKEKLSSGVDGLSTKDNYKDQLEERIIRLREELDRVREEKRCFKQEGDNIQVFWEISKGQLKVVESTLKIKIRERVEAEKRHQLEMSVYKEKLKNVLSEQHDAVSEMKMDTASSLLMVQKQNQGSELDLFRGVENLQEDFGEKQFRGESYIQQLQQKHQVELMELHKKYSSRLNVEELKFQQRKKTLMKAEEKKLESFFHQLEEEKKTVLQDQDQFLRQTEEYFSQINIKQQEDQIVLKDELMHLESQEVLEKKKLEDAMQKNEFLKKELQEAELKLSELQELEQKNLLLQKTVKKTINHQKERKKKEKKEQELRELTVEYELLLQACQKVEQERDELLRQQMETILDLKQKSGLKKMVLEKKIATMTEAVELEEAQLCAALSVSSINPEVRSNSAAKLQEILESKCVSVDTLQTDLARRCKEYDQLLNSSKELLQGAGGSRNDFPFRTAKQILKEATPEHQADEKNTSEAPATCLRLT